MPPPPCAPAGLWLIRRHGVRGRRWRRHRLRSRCGAAAGSRAGIGCGVRSRCGRTGVRARLRRHRRAGLPALGDQAVQALALVEAAPPTRSTSSDQELALACASHGGEPDHVSPGRGLARAAAWARPISPAAAPPLHRPRPRPRWPRRPAAPAGAQQLLRQAYRDAGGGPPPGLADPWLRAAATTRAAPLRRGDRGPGRAGPAARARHRRLRPAQSPAAAAGLARAAAILADQAGQAAEPWAALTRIGAAMRAHPHMVAGTGRCCTALMALCPHVVAKTGAEGAYLAAIPDAASASRQGRGWSDPRGRDGAPGPAGHLGALGEAARARVARWRRPTLRNAGARSSARSPGGPDGPAEGSRRPADRRRRRGRPRPAGRPGRGGGGDPAAADRGLADSKELSAATAPANSRAGPRARHGRGSGGLSGRDRAAQHPGRHAAGHAPRGRCGWACGRAGPGRRHRPPALDRPVRCVVGGDAIVPEISAASIVAKVARDGLMAGWPSAIRAMAGSAMPATRRASIWRPWPGSG